MPASGPKALKEGLPVKSVVSLPNTPSKIPERLTCSQSFTEVDASFIVAKECLSAITEPDIIIGSFETPINWWLAAQILFPEVERLLCQDGGEWLKIKGIDISNIGDDCDDNTAATVEKDQQNGSESASSRRAITEPNSRVSPGKNKGSPGKGKSNPVFETYAQFAWDNPNAENLYQQNLASAEAQLGQQPDLIRRIKQSKRQGQKAADLSKYMVDKIDKGESKEELENWIKEISETKPGHRVIKTLELSLERSFKFSEAKKSLGMVNKDFQITLPFTSIDEGLHPQSLRSLLPSARWEVYIDETGKEFTDKALDLHEADKTLGRVIALAMPKEHGLPTLNKTHATDLTYADVQQLLSTLTESNVGILGATLKGDLQSHSWIAAIVKLVRWTLMMLPIDGRTSVVFKIEERLDYEDSAALKALQETMTDELRQVAPDRFKDLQISLELVGKEHPYNGYVDVIANCWGSPDGTKKRLLDRTQWRGHCLLQSTDLAEIERLYQEAGSDVGSDAWFAICTHLAKEPGHSLFRDLLKKLGDRVQEHPEVWQRYLDEAQHRILLKKFDAGGLGRALAWLNEFQPVNARLPGLLQLRLKSAQLAADNHQGRCKLSDVAQVMNLAKELKDESAPDACEAALRIAISATNSFDFTSVVPAIENWVLEPVAVPGRLNHGKLLSTLGQLCAFRGEDEQAMAYFDKALDQFEQLSDPAQASSNQQQTMIYRTIVQLDLDAPESEEAVLQLVNKSTGKTGAASIQRLARSGSPMRFEQYVFLRWLVGQPQDLPARHTYLISSDEWKLGEGHPWMLINAYRAWLLIDSNREAEASNHLQKAVDDCSDSEGGLMLYWMAHCLHALGTSLGLKLDAPARDCPPSPFPSDHLHKLRDATTTGGRFLALKTLLPFNFH